MSEWLLALMLLVVPPGRTPRESEERGRERYGEIAVAVAEHEAPLFAGAQGRERTAALLLAVAFHESAFDSRVDAGTLRGRAGECGLWQAMSVHDCAAFVADRPAAARVALEMMRRSRAACSGPVEGMLRVYASGRCDRGERESRVRVTTAMRWFSAHPPPAPEASR